MEWVMKIRQLKRREFICSTAYGFGAVWFGGSSLVRATLARAAFMRAPLPQKFTAADTVTLGNTGIKNSRLAMGTGTVGAGHHSNQTALGVAGLSALLLNGYEQGLRFFDAADSYGSHPHVAEAVKHVPRDEVAVLKETWARDADSARAVLVRFRKDMGQAYLYVCLMHCVTECDCTERYKGVMDVFSEAK